MFIFGDDILLYFLAEGGEVVDPYNSMPAYFGDEAGGLTPSGGDAERLCRAFGVPEAAEDVHAVLHSPNLGAIDAEGIEPGAFQFTFEHERHEALAHRLGLPEWAVGLGYDYIEAGELPGPGGLQREDLTHVG